MTSSSALHISGISSWTPPTEQRKSDGIHHDPPHQGMFICSLSMSLKLIALFQSSPPLLEAQTAAPMSGPINPNRIDNTSQQAAPGPGDGSRVADPNLSNTSPTSASGRVPWKDQVIAYAKKTRGTLLRKEHGDQILAGEASAREPTRKG
ncbi:hypothetical protein DFH94DRAFT_292098 [Russula ochroleuca]|uniref:Uncharacterized protein n=1 Tax=Russula ochroleuca TaxID=152965 RepID=A0A9P5JWM8_9AGAM|nr:hypothetical protein DFH94DRAFT_292098 [Russula ochroleuca]